MRVTLISLIGAFSVGCATPNYTNNDVFAFKSPQEQQQFERRALAGDTNAAQRLLDYYMFVRNDPRNALYWARICASHGDSECAKSVRSLREIIREHGL